MTPAVYHPRVRTRTIYNPNDGLDPVLRYNHDVDIVRFKGRLWASWNANGQGFEDVPGQFNYLSVSDDFELWSRPVRPFTAEGGAENASEDDNQWQPIFANWKDETLFAAWCTFTGRKVYVSESRDGKRWVNREVPSAPKALFGKAVGFPTNHAITTSKDVMMVPCSVPFTDTPRCIVGNTQYAGILMSADGGKTWEWSEPIEALPWSEIDPDLAEANGEMCAIWEPSIWEYPDGRIGLFVRNSTSQDAPQRIDRSHRMLLYCESRDHGKTWTKARPVELDTICSRSFVWGGFVPRQPGDAKDARLGWPREASPESLLMVMNDQWVNTPRRISHDRYHLALWFSPMGDPDLFLPGPVIQPPGGYAFYPNGFVEAGRLYVAYTYPPEIQGSTVDALPDFTRPFLLPRGGRPGLVMEEDEAVLHHRTSTLGLVLTAEQTRAKRVALSFRATVDRYRSHRGEAFVEFPLLTLGGKTRDGGALWLRRVEAGKNIVEYRGVSGEPIPIGAFDLKKEFTVKVILGENEMTVQLDASPARSIPGKILRKIAFGGLYEKPEWIMDGKTEFDEQHSQVRLPLGGIDVA